MKIITLLVTASLIGIVAKAHPEAAPEADPNPQIDFTAQAGCGPPRLLPQWPNITARHGNPVKLACPLDTLNSCLVDSVEWYMSSFRPQEGERNGQQLMRDAAVKFDPLMVVFPKVSSEHRGWYTCVVGNTEGRAERSVYLDVQNFGGRRTMDSGQLYDRPSAPRRPPTPNQAPESLRRRPEDQESDEAVDGRFPVYSRFRGDRGFAQRFQDQRRPPPPPPSPRPTNPPMRPPTPASPQMPHPSSGTGQMEAIHQHLRYIYDKIDDFQGTVDSLEARLRRLERD